MSDFIRRRRASRDRPDKLKDPQDRPGNLRVGAAEERLDSLLEEEARVARAASLPPRSAAVRRLAADARNGAQAASSTSAATQDRSRADRTSAPEGGNGWRSTTGQDGWSETVRQSLEVLQRAFGPAAQGAGTYTAPPPSQSLLGPLFQEPPHGGQMGMMSSPQLPVHPGGENTGQSGDVGPRPRALDPYFISTPPQQSQGNVNPFWSDPGRREAPGGRLEMEQPRPGDRRSPTQQEVEAVRERVLREAEERFAKEIRKISGGGDSASFESVTSAGGERGPVYDKPNRVDAGLEVPPGLMGAKAKGEPQTNPLAVPETVRSLELPALPHPAVEGSALQFGDWLVLADLSATSQQWCENSLAAARRLYEQWLVATPLDRLRLRPAETRVDPLHLRVEQRGVAMLISVLPEQLRRDIISAGSPSTVSTWRSSFRDSGIGSEGSSDLVRGGGKAKRSMQVLVSKR